MSGRKESTGPRLMGPSRWYPMAMEGSKEGHTLSHWAVPSPFKHVLITLWDIFLMAALKSLSNHFNFSVMLDCYLSIDLFHSIWVFLVLDVTNDLWLEPLGSGGERPGSSLTPLTHPVRRAGDRPSVGWGWKHSFPRALRGHHCVF